MEQLEPVTITIALPEPPTKTELAMLYNQCANATNIWIEPIPGQVPVRRGCGISSCFCTGRCNEIIGYRDKLPGEE